MAPRRSALMGQRSKRNQAARLEQERHAQHLEARNDELAGQLNEKVNALKHVTVMMHDEAVEHNRFLENMVCRRRCSCGIMY